MADARIEELKLLLPRCLLPDWVRLGARLVRLLRDRVHPQAHEALLDRLLAQARGSAELRERRRLNVPRVSYPAELPITAAKDRIVEAIRSRQVVVVAGETGSGKTTQLPKMCLEAGLGIEAKIGCTQPRRVAALSISRRIAEELNVNWGREVGCKIRFDDRSSPETYIKLMTDGILLAETQGDPLLTEYNAIIIDEAHERSLNIDFLLGYLKGLLAQRKELKLIVTSATIDTEAFSRAFDNAPVIEVSGRLYPVEVAYAPFDETSEESGDMTYIDAAVSAAERVLCEPGDGDVLIFMPGERDIRETSDMLEGRFGREAEIIPLFGRLSTGEQQRIFVPSAKRKVVVATNIAETSLTIPNIRFVIDSGLARISRYNPRTRTKRLPVEPVSQSSANQRKGRSGRVRNGVCIRLYSEADFNERPPYTQPEIQRANLAEVILRMKGFRLGEIENFPFINPPTPAAIDSGYRLLQELGALDEARGLTPMGRDLARLPIDPTLGRMLLQSQHEHATSELLIIAAGLSIQDPRERPLEQREAAEAVHKRWMHPDSDFLTLLNIWNALHEQWETLRTQNQRRKFCKANFLSYLRMREWQDLYAQLHDALEDLGTVRLNESNAHYEAIHRSILSGLLGHVATKTNPNIYKAAGNRQVMVFPGSTLFERNRKEPKTAGPKAKGSPAPKTKQPEWIVAGEIVETTQVFARTVAGIEPEWIVQLAPHLCKITQFEPHWSARAGQVSVNEKATLYGLEVYNRKVAYAKVNPQEATEIFIRSALVEEDLFPETPLGRRDRDAASGGKSQEIMAAVATVAKPAERYAFLEHNRRVRQKLEMLRTRTRLQGLPDLDEALFEFYGKHLKNVASVDELNRWLCGQKPDALCATEEDLMGTQELSYDTGAFPDSVALGGQLASLSYAYAPGEDKDGVTIKLGLEVARALSPASLEWAVPGLREELIQELLRALPKSLRKELMPLAPKAAEIARELQPGKLSLLHDLAEFIHKRYGVQLSVSSWPGEALSSHLRPRIEVVGKDQKTIGAGRDLEQLREKLKQAEAAAASTEWQRAAQRWERYDLKSWSFDDLPAKVVIGDKDGMPLHAWPGLNLENATVCLRIFHTQDAAQRASLPAIQRLVEIAVERDLAWVERDLRAVAGFASLLGGLSTVEQLQAGALLNARRYVLPSEPFPVLAKAHFAAAVEQARIRLRGLCPKLLEHIGVILQLRMEARHRCLLAGPASGQGAAKLTGLNQLGSQTGKASRAYSGMANDLDALIPANWLEVIPFERLPHIPRYLKAMLIRADRAAVNLVKDQERVRLLTPFLQSYRELLAVPSKTPERRRELHVLRWMLEEYKVSLFAQELGTADPISPKRLEQQVELVRRAA